MRTLAAALPIATTESATAEATLLLTVGSAGAVDGPPAEVRSGDRPWLMSFPVLASQPARAPRWVVADAPTFWTRQFRDAGWNTVAVICGHRVSSTTICLLL